MAVSRPAHRYSAARIVARCRSVAFDDGAPPRSVNPLEGVRSQSGGDRRTDEAGSGMWFGNEYMNATHAAVRDDLDDVAGEQIAPRAAARSRPRSARRSGSAATPPSSYVSPDQNSMPGRPHHPLAVVLVQQHRAVERLAPTRPWPSSSAGARSRSRAASRRGAVASSSSVMQSQSTSVDQQRPLPDREPGAVPMPVNAPSGEARCGGRPQRVQRGPLLAGDRYVLTRVLAHWTARPPRSRTGRRTSHR